VRSLGRILVKKITITSTTGKELDYLGLHIDIKDAGIELSQRAMAAKLVGKTRGTANLPAAALDAEEALSE
jgi:hypothetical protein